MLSEYIEGELDQGQALQVEAHLLKCPVCSATLRGVQQVRLALCGLGRQSAPAHVELALSNCLREETAAGSRQRWLRSVTLTVALAMGMGIVLWPAHQDVGFEYAVQEGNQGPDHAWNAEPLAEGAYASGQDLAALPSPAFQVTAQVRPVSF